LRSRVHFASASMVETESSSEVSSNCNDSFTVIHSDEIEKTIAMVKLNDADYLT